MSSTYLRLLTFLPAILISDCAPSSLTFCLIYAASKLNRQGNNIQPWRTLFPIWNQFVVPCLVLTAVSWPAYRFLRRQVRWSGIPISLRFFTVCCDLHSQRLWHSQWSWHMFLELPFFLYDPTDVGHLISVSSAFSESSLDIWKFSVHVLLKSSLRILSIILCMWNEHNCTF